MDKASKTLFILGLLAIIAVIGSRYVSYIRNGDFVVDGHVACDPTTQSCFSYECDPADTECDDQPYEKVSMIKRDAPTCFEENQCTSFSCDPSWTSCEITLCSPDTVEEGEVCTTVNQ